MLKKIRLFFFLFIVVSRAVALVPLNPTDSLEQVLKNTTDPQLRFVLMRKIAGACAGKNPGKAWNYLEKSDMLARQLNDSAKMIAVVYSKGNYLYVRGYNDSALVLLEKAESDMKRLGLSEDLGSCYENLGGVYTEKGRYTQAIFWLEKATEQATFKNDKRLLAESLMNTGMVMCQMGERPKGIVKLQQALSMTEKTGSIAAQILLYIGSAYSETHNEEYALNYFNRSQEIARKEKDTILLIQADMYIANNHYYGKRYEKAIDIYKQVMYLTQNNPDSRVYAGAMGNIGNVYADMGQNDKALEYQFEAVGLFDHLQDRQGLVICYSAIGNSFYAMKQYDKSIEYYEKGLSIANEMGSLEDMIEIHYGLSRTYEALGDYKKAYTNFKEYKRFNDSVYNEDNTKKITELELNYRFQTQQKEQDLIQKNKEVLADEKLKRQKLLSYSSIVGILLLLCLVGFVLRSSAQRKRANMRLHEFNEKVLRQKGVIEFKNKEITDSINYAKRIQESILPIKTEIQSAFPDSFVLFKPRDVVSGDFYWFAKRGDKNIIACVDCTGHGVPGAFMSMIGNTLLNEIVNEKGIEKPSDILNLLHLRVRQSLKQDMENNETHDGMDIALCCIDQKKGLLEYAGANRSLYLIRNGVFEEFKPTKSPVGGHKHVDEREFSNNEIKIMAGDHIYLSTDGYADQFGGERGKKFMVRQFQQLLLEIQLLPMEQQGQLLKRKIEAWQGGMEQVDDILVMGINI